MKIISKYKDYYDYLQGIYGIDEKLVLDRREFKMFDFQPHQALKIDIYFCGKKYQGFFNNGTFYLGENLLKIGEEVKKKEKPRWLRKYGTGRFYKNESEVRQVCIELPENYIRGNYDRENYLYLNLEPVESDLKETDDCPIIVSIWGNSYNFHPLGPLGFSSVLSPEDTFKELSNYLANKITEEENFKDTRSEEQRIESRGFDKKRSFRPKMKS
jgi:hypothetical protein